MNDDELIAALAAGDDAALRELFTRHAPWLAARLRAALPPPDVEDVIIEAGAAAVIAVTAQSPFGEAERATGRWLPYLRLLIAVALAGLALLALQLGVVGESLNDGVLVLARNVIGFTGLGLACSLVTGGLLAWTLPLGYMLFCQYALLELWRAPWAWPVRPAADRGAWICASVVFAVGLLLFTIRGPRTRLSDNG
jgi:hypothetical protein